MKIVFISSRLHGDGLARMYLFRQMPTLSIHRLAFLTPDEWEIEIIDNDFAKIDFDSAPDLVAISTTTPGAPEAYRISGEFRSRGSKTIIGGAHVSFQVEEALRHADCVVVGEADDIWTQILSDFKDGRLRKIYDSHGPADIENDHSLSLVEIPYNIPGFHVPVTQTTRGCPLSCSFCSVSALNGNLIRHRPIKTVVDEIEKFFASHPSLINYLVFVDDNITIDRKYAIELFRAIKPLNLRWISQADVRIAVDKVLLREAVESGLIASQIGFEAIQKDALNTEVSLAKGNWRGRYEEAIKILHSEGVMVEGLFIFGMDSHEKDVFERTVEWALENIVDVAQFSVWTPFPGTKLFKNLKKEERITVVDRDGRYKWERFDMTKVVFRPAKMTPAELENGFWQAYRDFYSSTSIFKRMRSWGWRNRRFMENICTFLANWSFKHCTSV